MKALNQETLNQRYNEVQAAYTETEKAITELKTKQENLRRHLNRIQINQVALADREVPDYPTWLRAHLS
ncbi:MAG: hypothetical protein AAF629_16560 [Chloroflexota bacterium]